MVYLGRRRSRDVGKPALSISADVGLHAKVPLVAFFGGTNLGISLLAPGFGRAGGMNNIGIENTARRQ